MTIDDLRNPARKSGYDHVAKGNQHAGRPNYCTYYAKVYGGKLDKAGTAWRGPSRKTPEEAAQDYCDYVNSGAVTPATPALRMAGHDYDVVKAERDPEIEAALGVLRDARAQRRGVQGFVYAITDGEFIKIGYSVNPRKRVSELQTGNARLLSLLGTIKGTKDDEARMHAKYEHLNVLQEWFEIDTAILADFVPTVKPAAVQQAA